MEVQTQGRRRAALPALLLAVAVIFGMLSLPAMADHPVEPEGEDHCPGAQDEDSAAHVPVPDGYEVDGDKNTADPEGSLNDEVPEEGTFICIKAGNEATGIFEVDDSGRTLQEWLEHFEIVGGDGEGRDVSHYMTYTFDEEVTPGGEEEEELFLTLVKAWDVTDDDDLWDENEASYTLLLGGAPFTEPIEVEEGDEVGFGEEDVSVPEGCEFLGSDAGTYVVDAEDADGDGLITLTLTNEVECEEDDAPAGGQQQPGETVDVLGEEEVVEVLGEEEVLPESIPAGDGGYLPATNATGLLVLLLTGLGVMLSGFALQRGHARQR